MESADPKKRGKPRRYVMKISRTTIDKLGVKLYDKVSTAVSELVANSYDADAENVFVRLPLNTYLATKDKKGGTSERGLAIEISDDGHGMTRDEAIDYFLAVGKNRRDDPNWGAKSRHKKRDVLGRKGIGKLAPFGICKEIDVRTCGGKKTGKGYRVSHFILNYDDIVQPTDKDYDPDPGEDDLKWDDEPGTRIRLSRFYVRKVPDEETFHRQMARRFSLQGVDFRIAVVDTGKDPPYQFDIGDLPIQTMPHTHIDVEQRPLVLEDGTKLPMTGWVAYSKEPYKNEEVAGVRIYARKKLVAVARDFGMPSGYWGEFYSKSYLVGGIHADWLDEDEGEDLIQTHRQDILWSSEQGREFQKWGQQLIRDLGKLAFPVHKERVRQSFLRIANIKKLAKERFPYPELQEAAIELGRLIGGIVSEEELKNKEYVRDVGELVLVLAPHKYLVDSFREIAQETTHGPKILVDLFGKTRIAEMGSYGQIAYERIRAINQLEKAIADPKCEEKTLQKILERGPWLIDPQWTVITRNQSLRTFRSAFERWYRERYKKSITTTTLAGEGKRPDFVLLHVGARLEILEIKKRGHTLTNKEFRRLNAYISSVDEFLIQSPDFKEDFPEGVHATIVCDKVKLDSIEKRAMNDLRNEGKLGRPRNWEEFLRSTKKAHQDFLDEQERLRELGPAGKTKGDS